MRSNTSFISASPSYGSRPPSCPAINGCCTGASRSPRGSLATTIDDPAPGRPGQGEGPYASERMEAGEHPFVTTLSLVQGTRCPPTRVPFRETSPAPPRSEPEPSCGRNLTPAPKLRKAQIQRRRPPADRGHRETADRSIDYSASPPARFQSGTGWMRTLTAAGLLFLALAAPAAADDFRPADSYPELGAVLPIARAAWPDSPCRDHENIEFVANISSETNGGEPALGAAPGWGNCIVGLHPMLIEAGHEYLLCIVVSHEFGHLAGYEHTDDPADVMYPYAQSVEYPPCYTFRPPPGPEVIQPTPALTPPPATPRQTPTAKPARPRAGKKCRQKSRKARRACLRKHRA